LGYRRVELDNPLHIAANALQGLGDGFRAGALGDGLDLARGAVIVVFVVVLAFVFTSRRCWRDPRVRLLLASAGGYTLLLVASASVNRIDPLYAQRFWLPVWPLLGGAALASLSAAGIRDWAVKAAAGVFAALLLLTGAGFATRFLRELPSADSGRGYFEETLAQSAPVRFIIQERAADCILFSNDGRVVLMYTAVDRINDLPFSADDLEAILRSDEVCILFFAKTKTPRIEARRLHQRSVIETLRDRGLLERVAADGVGEVWRSPS
jgi:hypothetical protein